MSPPRTNPLVSVCIANYNGEHLLDACIASVQAQAGPFTVEILVHDDASTDASLEVLGAYPNVIVIASAENVGYCISNNRLAERANGQYLLLLNNDATLRPGAIETLVKAAAQAKSTIALSLPQYDHATGALVDRGMRLDFLHTPFANQVANFDKLAYVQAACMLVRRSTWEDLGGFPEWMVSNAEDTYFCALVRLTGGQIAVVEGSGYDHRQGTSFGGNRSTGNKLFTTYRRRYLSERNRAGMILVCTPGPLAYALFLLQLVTLASEGLLVSAAKLSPTPWSKLYWPAIRDIVSLLPKLRVDRARAQRLRRIGVRDYLSALAPKLHKIDILRRKGFPDLQ